MKKLIAYVYYFCILMILLGAVAVFGGGNNVRDGYELIALGGITAMILTLTRGHHVR